MTEQRIHRVGITVTFDTPEYITQNVITLSLVFSPIEIRDAGPMRVAKKSGDSSAGTIDVATIIYGIYI